MNGIFSRIKGFTIIQMLIVLMLTGIVIHQFYNLFFIHRKAYLWLNEWVQIQENARSLTLFFQDELHTGGYIGCGQLTVNFPIYNHIKKLPVLSRHNRVKKLASHEVNLNKMPLENSDILMVNKMSTQTWDLLHNNILRDQLKIPKNPIVQAGDYLVIADCRKADMVAIKGIISANNQVQILQTGEPIRSYNKGAQIGFLESNIYFIADTHRTNSQGKPINALYVTDIYGNTTELWQGIDKMLVEVENRDAKMTLVKLDFILSSIEALDLKSNKSTNLGFAAFNWSLNVILRG